ncbi:MAG TPA: 5-(carboxyamino)imidazole ribonucleotide synthase [Chitinophagaceae bacterium]|nr:5-(carboxyamino)imidazole ribonucleotide synthase [Chitinophagaceae bacterium]
MKVGILGGGQLGRMLLQAAANYTVETFVLENDPECPAAHLCNHFTKGDIKNFDDVYNFGKHLDAITIEIESVNTDALQKLQEDGVKIFPAPATLSTIKNKILQKQYYASIQVPSPEFIVTQNINEVKNNAGFLPAVHKVATGGYDGRGVVIIKDEKQIDKGFDAPAVLEAMVQIKKEIAIIVSISQKGETALYPPVEMIFNNDLNLLQYHLCPASLPEKTLWKAEAIALTVAKNFKSAGIFAVEMFVDIDENVWVNETAPRVHNSGHHTIEGNYCSQFDMLWRIILDYPLGNTNVLLPSAMINLIGEDNFSGKVIYEGLREVLKIDNAFVHLYGKKETRPGRKMGHVTVISSSPQDLTYKANLIRHTLKVKS